jgi:DNA-binding PadR family transcriptional regulator
LKRLERNGWLRSEAAIGEGKRRRRYYHLTKRGAAVLEVLRETVVELHHEVVEEAAAHARRRPFQLPQTPSETTSAPRHTTTRSAKARSKS